MVSQDSLLVTLVTTRRSFADAARCQRSAGVGIRKVYSDHLFFKALVIMIVRHLHNVHELLSVLEPADCRNGSAARACSASRDAFHRVAPGNDA